LLSHRLPTRVSVRVYRAGDRLVEQVPPSALRSSPS